MSLTDTLREAITSSGANFRALERETGVLRQSLMPFVRGDATIRLDAADKLAAHFGLVLQVVGSGTAKKTGAAPVTKTAPKKAAAKPDTKKVAKPKRK